MIPLKKYLYFGIAALSVVAADQISKIWIIEELPYNGQINIIPGFFNIVNIRNRGAAFGFLNNPETNWQFWLFLGATIVAMAAILILLRDAKNRVLMIIGLGFILGGAIGNLIDRVQYRSVVDFLDFYWRGWHWPAFNIADSGICVGACLVCFALWRQKDKVI